MKNEMNTNSGIENTSNKKSFFLRSIWEIWLKKFLKYLSLFFIIVFGITWLLFYVIPFAQELSFLFLPETHKEFIAADNKISDKFKDKVIT